MKDSGVNHALLIEIKMKVLICDTDGWRNGARGGGMVTGLIGDSERWRNGTKGLEER